MTTESGTRFAFGENWRHFLHTIDEHRVQEAERSLIEMLKRPRLDGLRFCDVGVGSGLFSLAALRLGATVHSFDIDQESVDCAEQLRSRFARDSSDAWTIERGDVLDLDYLRGIGTFDVVYSWGVLHHTGAMWRALGNAANLVGRNGVLYVALYNDQGVVSQAWRLVKRTYNMLPRGLRFLVLLPTFVVLWGSISVRDLIRMRPLSTWRRYDRRRGMSPWHDVVDWVGGYPYEVARPEAVINFVQTHGLDVTSTRTTRSLGCNEFLFQRDGRRQRDP